MRRERHGEEGQPRGAPFFSLCRPGRFLSKVLNKMLA
jgi:hypothetical protein